MSSSLFCATWEPTWSSHPRIHAEVFICRHAKGLGSRLVAVISGWVIAEEVLVIRVSTQTVGLRALTIAGGKHRVTLVDCIVYIVKSGQRRGESCGPRTIRRSLPTRCQGVRNPVSVLKKRIPRRILIKKSILIIRRTHIFSVICWPRVLSVVFTR